MNWFNDINESAVKVLYESSESLAKAWDKYKVDTAEEIRRSEHMIKKLSPILDRLLSRYDKKYIISRLKPEHGAFLHDLLSMSYVKNIWDADHLLREIEPYFEKMLKEID